MPPKNAATSPQRQQTISSYFSKKRKSSPIDLTAGDNSDRESPTKKTKSLSVQPGKGKQRDVGQVPSQIEWLPFDDVGINPMNACTSNGHSEPKDRDESFLSAGKSIFSGKMKRRISIRKDKDGISSKRSSMEDVDTAVYDPQCDLTSSNGCILRKFASTSSLPRDQGASGRQRGKKEPVIGPEGLPCTPLEEAVIQFKKKYPDTVLLIEVGYKYWQVDIAGRFLGFSYGLDRNFLRTSCPEHNLRVNVKKLVAAGYKVGVVSQVETAALKKAGDNRNTLFERQLTQLYTPSTFVDDLDSPDEFGQATPPLMCIVEEIRGGLSPDDKVLFGIISVVPSTGDVIYDQFQDTVLRTELETRLAHTRPCELLLPPKLSTPTEKVLHHFKEHGHVGKIRVERTNHRLDYSKAFDYISEYHSAQSNHIASAITDLPKLVIVALALAIKHLSAFGLSDVLLQTKFFHKFVTRAHLLLDTSTLRNLEIFRNQSDFTEKGTLFAVLNHTTTSFGKRLFKSWVSRPLMDKHALQQRVDAVEEARLGDSPKLILLRDLLKGLPDLARGLCSVQYGRCAPKELATFLTTLNRIGSAFPKFSEPTEVGCSSTLWTDILFVLPALQSPTKDLLASINIQRAKENNKTELWVDLKKFASLDDTQLAIRAVESDLADQLKKIRKYLKMPSLKYVSVLSEEFLIEVPKERASTVPANWVRMGSTKNMVRFHTPEVVQLLHEREQHKEILQAEADKAYKSFLRDIAQRYYTLFRDVVNKLAVADCLMSLAIMSLQGDVCRPSFVERSSISIVDGRHPIIEQIRPEPFVPNTISIGGDSPRNLVISGPNMGGKTSVVKLVALLVLMAQIGSYVPARCMTLSIHDAILTRMGASDDLAAGRSTFMVEISETRDIINSATPNSLVVLDELGVGTSTFDGMAIAGAVLEYLCQEVKCQTLFITHYPALARELEVRFPQDIGNRHMGFIEDIRIDGRREIRFLYRLTQGISKGSFGIECARLAGLPEPILQKATSKAAIMQKLMEEKARNANARKLLQLLLKCVLVSDMDNATLHEIETHKKIMGI